MPTQRPGMQLTFNLGDIPLEEVQFFNYLGFLFKQIIRQDQFVSRVRVQDKMIYRNTK